MISFFIPGFYLLYSRLKRKSEVVSLLIIYPIFLIVALLLFTEVDTLQLILSFTIAWMAWLAAYEIGYLENDAITIKKESNPTLRMKPNEILWVQENFLKIQIIRGLIAATILFLLYQFFDHLLVTKDFLIFVGCIIAARFFFYMHNTIRSRWNIATYVLLSTTKYMSLPLLFTYYIERSPELFIALFLSFPVIRTIEHAAKTKYNIQWVIQLVGNIDFFRLKYYTVGLITSLLCYLVWDYHNAIVFIYTFGYFFIFRFLNVLLVSSGTYIRTKSRAHK